MLTRIRNRIRRDIAALSGSSADRRALLRECVHGGLQRAVALIGTETADGTCFFSQTADKTIGRHLYSRGQWDAETLPNALDLASIDIRGRLLVEVGANIGTTTVQAAMLGAAVLAFEPEPWNYRLLRANLAVNDLDSSVTVVRAGCSSTDRSGLLKRSEVNYGDHRVSDSGDVPIELVSLDSYLKSHQIPVESVAMLWLDTQGHEPEVLLGAREVLAARPVLVSEFWPEMIGSRLDVVIGALSEYSTLVDLATGHPITDLYETAEMYEKSWTNILAVR